MPNGVQLQVGRIVNHVPISIPVQKTLRVVLRREHAPDIIRLDLLLNHLIDPQIVPELHPVYVGIIDLQAAVRKEVRRPVLLPHLGKLLL